VNQTRIRFKKIGRSVIQWQFHDIIIIIITINIFNTILAFILLNLTQLHSSHVTICTIKHNVKICRRKEEDYSHMADMSYTLFCSISDENSPNIFIVKTYTRKKSF